MPSISRTPVVAVGSNASPHVLIDKLGHLLGPGPNEHVILDIHHIHRLRVGHSAHVSQGGYVAATPFLSDTLSEQHSSISPATDKDLRAPSTYCVGWFTPRHLAALDATEPNYYRALLPGDVAPVQGAQVYVSVHGVVGEGGQALPLLPQRDLHTWLRARLPCLQAISTDHPRPYADAHLRAAVHQELGRFGLVVPSGFVSTLRH